MKELDDYECDTTVNEKGTHVTICNYKYGHDFHE